LAPRFLAILSAPRWREALEAGYCSLADLKRFALDLA
jgi:hypothetical protein